MTKLKPPSIAQSRVLETLDILVDNWGTQPSLREIAGEIDLNPSTVLRHLRTLEEAGWVERTNQPTRQYRLTRAGLRKSLLYKNKS